MTFPAPTAPAVIIDALGRKCPIPIIMLAERATGGRPRAHLPGATCGYRSCVVPRRSWLGGFPAAFPVSWLAARDGGPYGPHAPGARMRG